MAEKISIAVSWAAACGGCDVSLLDMEGELLQLLDIADVKDVGVGSVSEATRADFRIEYRYQINRDWDWRIGYIGRYRENAAGTTANSNAIVTSVGRSFSIRP